MKTTLFMLAVASILLSIVSCSKSDGIKLQAHDSNRMMDSMHVMMNKMDTMKITNDPDIDFAAMMKLHHEGAISMANLELQQGKNDSMKRTAQMIIDMQTQEIHHLTTILSMLSEDNTDAGFAMEQKNNMEKMDKTADTQLITGDIDNDFATLMIVHHQAASDNASAYLHHGGNADLKTMAADMITAQTKEIADLASWLKANKR